MTIKPFIKWVGGKTSLIPEISTYFPDLKTLEGYAEPFLGGGAMLIYILKHAPNLKVVYANDANPYLINTWQVIQKEPKNLIMTLNLMAQDYRHGDDDDKKTLYYRLRDEFNNNLLSSGSVRNNLHVRQAALFIFLNKTCFNGIFRVNKNGRFNVPYGKYKNPAFLDANNILALSRLIQKVKFTCLDYKEFLHQHYSGQQPATIHPNALVAIRHPKLCYFKNAFIYFDPPYRPLTTSSNFTAYTATGFNDKDQSDLAAVFEKVSNHNSQPKLMLSNSDPKNIDINDNFFDDLYSKYNIHRITAKRTIAAKSTSRQNVTEILVTNF